jgi:transcriptional regulator NrdR family protein
MPSNLTTMKFCNHRNSQVVDSRPMSGYRYRRYKCHDCGESYTTVEVKTGAMCPQSAAKLLVNLTTGKIKKTLDMMEEAIKAMKKNL